MKKSETIYDAVTQLPDPLVEEAAAHKFKGRHRFAKRFAASIAALLAITIAVGSLVRPASRSALTAYAIAEAEYPVISPYPDESDMWWGSESTTYYPFTATIENGDDLTSGDWVEISLDAGSESALADDGFYLWRGMVRDDDGGRYVFARGGNGKLEKRYIQTGTISGQTYEVLSGITPDDWIAFPYGKEVRTGAKTREGSSSELYEY